MRLTRRKIFQKPPPPPATTTVAGRQKETADVQTNCCLPLCLHFQHILTEREFFPDKDEDRGDQRFLHGSIPCTANRKNGTHCYCTANRKNGTHFIALQTERMKHTVTALRTERLEHIALALQTERMEHTLLHCRQKEWNT